MSLIYLLGGWNNKGFFIYFLKNFFLFKILFFNFLFDELFVYKWFIVWFLILCFFFNICFIKYGLCWIWNLIIKNVVLVLYWCNKFKICGVYVGFGLLLNVIVIIFLLLGIFYVI